MNIQSLFHRSLPRLKNNLAIVIASLALLAVLFDGAPGVFAHPWQSPDAPDAGAPGVVSYQGQVTQSGTPYTGTGYFKFAIVNAAGSTSYWSNNNSSVAGSEPTASVALSVNRGLFSVLLGDTSLSGMTEALSYADFSATDRLLRVWFSADGVTFTQLSPDRKFAAVPFAYQADNSDLLDGQHGTYYRNASNINTGTLGADYFSAYADLDAEGYVHNAAGDLAQNNGTLQSTLNADLLDGLHASSLGVPSGAMVLGLENDANLLAAGFVSKGATDVMSWLPTNTSRAPAERKQHTAVWTGSEMIVWGGFGDSGSILNTGARYDPSTDFWTATTLTGAPAARLLHTAVWTGSEMIIWGGYNGLDLNTGARYNPTTNTWTALPTTGAPSARYNHTAVWTGSEMIVWGGTDDSSMFDTGARYNPSTNTWAAMTTTGAPEGRENYPVVWTGSEMIVWGGKGWGTTRYNTGARYNPSTNTWTALPTSGAPSARNYHTAVWTGSEMIIWGGYNDTEGALSDGASYFPSTNTWADISSIDVPAARFRHIAVWTGNMMIIWGGSDGYNYYGNGAGYDPTTHIWTTLATSGAPLARFDHTAVWTGSEMLVWGGDYDDVLLDTGGRLLLDLFLYRKP